LPQQQIVHSVESGSQKESQGCITWRSQSSSLKARLFPIVWQPSTAQPSITPDDDTLSRVQRASASSASSSTSSEEEEKLLWVQSMNHLVSLTGENHAINSLSAGNDQGADNSERSLQLLRPFAKLFLAPEA
jgi:hypothetical protein